MKETRQTRDARREAKWAAQDAADARQDRIREAEVSVVGAAVACVDNLGPSAWHECGLAGQTLRSTVKELQDARKAAKL